MMQPFYSSENFDVKSLRTACCEHLAQNFGELLDGDKLSELKPAAWVEMLQADDLQIKYYSSNPSQIHPADIE